MLLWPLGDVAEARADKRCILPIGIYFTDVTALPTLAEVADAGLKTCGI